MVRVGRDLCGPPSPTLPPKQGHLQHAAEDLVQAGLEHLQKRRLHHLPGQPVPVLTLVCREDLRAIIRWLHARLHLPDDKLFSRRRV